MPDWLLIVIVAVVIIVVGFIAWSQGWLNPDTFKKTKLLSVLLWRLKNA